MIHHIGYVVGDLQAEIPRWVESTGAGPFFLIEHLEFDEVTFRGNPAEYDHSSAFGAWGPIIVELTQVHSVAPEALRVELGHRHVAWLADSLEDERERLRGLGLTPFHTGRTGPASAVWLDGGPLFPHPVEVLQSAEPLLSFYARVRDAADGWDGSEPIRPVE